MIRTWVWVAWHRVRRHRAYHQRWAHRWAGACNTCDEDYLP